MNSKLKRHPEYQYLDLLQDILDNGGSTALWSGGYKVGPGRNLPNVILFVSK